MPLPKPKEGEEEKEFISRCVSFVFEESDELDKDNEDDRKQAVAMCYSQWREAKGEKAVASNALKAISRTDDELRAANYIVLFGGRDIKGAPDKNYLFYTGEPNLDGSIGEYFTKATDFTSQYTETGMLHVDWEHGLEPDGGDIAQPGRDDVLGVVDWKTARVDDKGVWVERVLNRRNLYVKYLEALIDAGIISTSSESMEKGVEVAPNGEIKRWPLKRDTLTVTPMEPRMLTQNVIQAVKALIAVDPRLESLLSNPEPKADDGRGSAGALRQRGLHVRARLHELKAKRNQ